MKTFYLGTHKPKWLTQISVPFFVSRRTLPKKPWKANVLCNFAIDSGGFSELNLYGKWKTEPNKYIEEINIWNSTGKLDFAATQDWMCEPYILKKTGLSVVEHQRRTIDSYAHLLSKSPSINWLPVIQGFTLEEYISHIKMYEIFGLPINNLYVGVGSVCRRQSIRGKDGIDGIIPLFKTLKDMGCKIHAFGLKKSGIPLLNNYVYSADSLAWSYQARKVPKLESCKGHKKCTNCKSFALKWLEEIKETIKNAN